MWNTDLFRFEHLSVLYPYKLSEGQIHVKVEREWERGNDDVAKGSFHMGVSRTSIGRLTGGGKEKERKASYGAFRKVSNIVKRFQKNVDVHLCMYA